ncbi:hypothetical protein [Pantoea agglomerans]|uniref:hypothetical protein n=1 Tax=Enterobacter agglomerans TaxID=549 RepID=UPI001FD927EC|nr:hypothetical protein [Pantoea agglomerans]
MSEQSMLCVRAISKYESGNPYYSLLFLLARVRFIKCHETSIIFTSSCVLTKIDHGMNDFPQVITDCRLNMKTVKAYTLDDARLKLTSGNYKGILIDFDISADEFFVLSNEWKGKNARIEKVGSRFLINNTNPNETFI